MMPHTVRPSKRFPPSPRAKHIATFPTMEQKPKRPDQRKPEKPGRSKVKSAGQNKGPSRPKADNKGQGRGKAKGPKPVPGASD
jgi:hypothetical protein